MYRIGKVFRFEAGHSLPHLPEGHKCRRPHGHSYQVEVILESEELDENGFVVDYAQLDQFKKWIDLNVDHRDLNKIVAPTTAEYLARWFWERLNSFNLLANPETNPEARIICVRVKETENTFAEFIP
jgi:6-pyruvoyltetrahydropterin/6-carboxytetrahydropterin synthase